MSVGVSSVIFFWVAPQGGASLSRAISFCCRGNCYFSPSLGGRHPNGPERTMSHPARPRTARSPQEKQDVSRGVGISKISV